MGWNKYSYKIISRIDIINGFINFKNFIFDFVVKIFNLNYIFNRVVLLIKYYCKFFVIKI